MWKSPVESWLIDPKAGTGNLEAKQPFIDNGLDVYHPSRYYSAEFMQREWTNMWTRCWLIAGVETDIPEAGDYSVFRLLRESIVIVRQQDGSVKAFYNVCPHRGNQIVLNDRGSVKQFTCTFHSWQFGLDGKCKHITDEDTVNPNLLTQRPRLGNIQCTTYAGLVFINLDEKAAPLQRADGPAQRLPRGV